MPGISKSKQVMFFECFYYFLGIDVMNNFLQINQLCESSSMYIYDYDDYDTSGGSIEIKLADLDKDQYVHFVCKLIDFSNNEGSDLISYIETNSFNQEISVEFKSNFEENLKNCVKQCWGKNKQ